MNTYDYYSNFGINAKSSAAFTECGRLIQYARNHLEPTRTSVKLNSEHVALMKSAFDETKQILDCYRPVTFESIRKSRAQIIKVCMVCGHYLAGTRKLEMAAHVISLCPAEREQTYEIEEIMADEC